MSEVEATETKVEAPPAVDIEPTGSKIISETVETKVSAGGTVVEETTTVIEVTLENGVTEEEVASAEDGVVEETRAVSVNGRVDNGELTGEDKSEVLEVKTADDATKANEITTEESTTGEDACDGATSAEVAVEVVEETVEEPAKVILHQFPQGEHIPNLSPFCLKLETFMRMNEIPYESQYGYKVGKKGKLPWIDYKGERVPDSNMIITFLNEKFDVDMDKHFSAEKMALGRSVQRMLEENTYWALIYNRYVDNFNEYRKFTAPSTGTGIGFNITQKMFQRKMKSNLEAHGLGLHSKDEIYEIASQDLKALSTILGEQGFLLGDSPSTFDCTFFGLCGNILYSGMESPLADFVKENAANLSSYCDRMRDMYWSNWADALRKSETAPLKRGFSFKKRPAKKAKIEEATLTADAAPADVPAGDAPTDVPAVNAPVDVPADDAPADIPVDATAVAPTEDSPSDATIEETAATDLVAEAPAADVAVTTDVVPTDEPAADSVKIVDNSTGETTVATAVDETPSVPGSGEKVDVAEVVTLHVTLHEATAETTSQKSVETPVTSEAT